MTLSRFSVLLFSLLSLGSAHTLYRTSAPVFQVQDLGYGWTQYRFCLPWFEETVTADDVIGMEFQIKFSGTLRLMSKGNALGETVRVNFDFSGPSSLPWAVDLERHVEPSPQVAAFSMMPFIAGEAAGWSLEDLEDNVVSGTIVSSYPIDRMGIALLSNATLGLVSTPPEGSCDDPCLTTYDRCGVCGGDSSSCMGCDDTPNAAVDNCGVCGGEDECMETVPIEDSIEVPPPEFPTTISLPNEPTVALDLYTFVILSLGGFGCTLIAAFFIQRCARRRQQAQRAAAPRPRLVYMIPAPPQLVYQPLKYPA